MARTHRITLASTQVVGRIAAALATLALVGTLGCETKTLALPADRAEPIAARPPAVLGPGDELDVRFYYAPELNVQQSIRPDGMLTLQLVGEVPAADLTPSQLEQTLRDKYAGHLKYPDVSVIVRRMNSRRVIVTGEVLRPGSIDMPAPLTLFEAIALSGGFLHVTANTKQVIVTRDNGRGDRVGYVVNMNDELSGATVKPFMLAPTDIVIVPRTAIVNVNQFVQQYINNNLPSAGVVYSRDTGPGTVSVDSRGTR